MADVRNLEPSTILANPDGTPGERLKGWTRSVVDRLNDTPFVQAPTAVDAAISSTAGATYTATEQAMLNDMKSLLNQLRAALASAGVVA